MWKGKLPLSSEASSTCHPPRRPPPAAAAAIAEDASQAPPVRTAKHQRFSRGAVE